MKSTWMVLALLGSLSNAAAVEVTATVSSDGASSPYAAKQIAKSLLRQAGVNITWRKPAPDARADRTTCLHIELVGWSPLEYHPGALAVAYPFAGCSKRITVFVDRVRAFARGAEREAVLLGYVLAHEITHVIQGVDRHSATGIMKERWNSDDRQEIFHKRLGFLEEDVELMDREPLAAPRARAVPLTPLCESQSVCRPG